DLVLLPETFTSGFSNEAIDQAEGMDGPTVAWMRDQAAALGAVVSGSVQLRDGGRVYNRMLWVRPDGSLAHYDKRHLFTYAREHERYAPGRDRLVVELKGWRIHPLVCYDLRFPVFARNTLDPATGRPDFDLQLYVANWPAARAYAWKTLLRARDRERVLRGRPEPGGPRRQRAGLFGRQRGDRFPRRAAERVRRRRGGGDHHPARRCAGRAPGALPRAAGRGRLHPRALRGAGHGLSRRGDRRRRADPAAPRRRGAGHRPGVHRAGRRRACHPPACR